ncbi:hypothetical protein [Oceanomicrobium pacificus]|uniref:Uncharacterized protein n=1 Tax=Oceanomicrobium pacificus TaxID=2692916 RepID=A0A6B0TVV6_9RHOB|nr:hypothetical protein [Oceanomicrobium pacificus]MXU65362.1 hypothetical protein [Oceanomicrobium pacificus]
MTDLTPDWDFELQQAQTAATLHQLRSEADFPQDARVTLDLTFVPGAGADLEAATRALGMFGYAATPSEDGGFSVAVEDVALAVDEIWLHEERTSRIALARGFTPDGWGFWEP